MSRDPSGAAAAAVPPPAPGSARYFVLLYAPPARRAALATLLAIADELGAGLHRQLDHGIAHVRLEWWRQEAERNASGAPAHPWLNALRAADQPPLSLQPLVEAAAIDLASATLADSSEPRLPQARLVAAARSLAVAELSSNDEQRLAQLGGWIDELDALRPTAAGQTPLPAAPSTPRATLQPALTPLLVWAALARAGARRRLRRARGGSGTIRASAWDGLADNFTAWCTARRATRGRFSFEADPNA